MRHVTSRGRPEGFGKRGLGRRAVSRLNAASLLEGTWIRSHALLKGLLQRGPGLCVIQIAGFLLCVYLVPCPVKGQGLLQPVSKLGSYGN